MAEITQKHRAHAVELVSKLGCWGRDMTGQPDSLGHIDIDLVAQAIAEAESRGSASRPGPGAGLENALEEQRIYFAAYQNLLEWQRDVRRVIRDGGSGFEALEAANSAEFSRGGPSHYDVPASLASAPASAEGVGGWAPLLMPDGTVAVDEGQTYLFAIEIATNGGPPQWEHFVDAVVWDAETEPQWCDGDHGWDINDEIFFRPLPSPPAPPKGGET